MRLVLSYLYKVVSQGEGRHTAKKTKAKESGIATSTLLSNPKDHINISIHIQEQIVRIITRHYKLMILY